ncbi:MAG: hypothetical protein ABJA67_02790 [Chthonomonadales bacterium]
MKKPLRRFLRPRYIFRFVIGFIVFGMLFLVFGRPPVPQLLQNAHRIADISHWVSYTWVDDSNIMVIERDQNSKRLVAYRLRVNDLSRTEYPGLSKTLNELGSDCNFLPSPDGKWIMASCMSENILRTESLITVSNGVIAGSHFGKVVYRWLPDSSGWTEDLPFSPVHLECNLFIDGRPMEILPPILGGWGYDLETTRDGIAWLLMFVEGTRSVELSQVNYRTGKALSTNKINMPDHQQYQHLSVSDNASKLVMQTRVGPDFWETMSLIACKGFNSWQINETWLLNADGSGLQLIGDADVTFDDGGSSNLNVNWVPGSRRLSIKLEDTLYYLDVK